MFLFICCWFDFGLFFFRIWSAEAATKKQQWETVRRWHLVVYSQSWDWDWPDLHLHSHSHSHYHSGSTFSIFHVCVGSLVRITGQLCRISVPLIVVYLYNYKIESSHKFVWFSSGGVLSSSEFPLLKSLSWQRVKVLKIVNSFNTWGKTSFWIDILVDGGKSTWRSGMPANGPQSGLIAVA